MPPKPRRIRRARHAEQAATAAQGLNATPTNSKNATAKRNDAARAERAKPRARAALKRANADLTRARGNAVRAAQRASDARGRPADVPEASLSSSPQQPRLRKEATDCCAAGAYQPLQGPAGGTVVDRGYEGARGREFFVVDSVLRIPMGENPTRTDKRISTGRPPIGEDGAPINRSSPYPWPDVAAGRIHSKRQHRELGLHEPGLDSEIDRQEFDRERERYGSSARATCWQKR